MKRTLICALAASLAVLASCSREEPAKKTGTFTINFGAEAKVYMNYQGYTFWTPKDQISVFSTQGTCRAFTATTEFGAETSNFTCYDWILAETPKWAVFCYEEKTNPLKPYDVQMTSDGVFSANVSEYQPVSVSHSFGSFGSKANVSVGVITKVGNRYSGLMKNALGLIKVTIPSGVENVSEIILEDAAGTAPIAGKVTVDGTGDVPECTPVNGQGKSRISAKWIGKDSNAFPAGKPVCFCVIPGGVPFTPKFTFVKADGYKASVTGDGPISVSTNRICDCGTPESLEFTYEGRVKKVVTLTFAENPFNEPIPQPTGWKSAAKTLPLTLKSDANLSYFLKNSDVSKSGGDTFSSYKLETEKSRLIFYGGNADLTEYIQINCPAGGKIAKVQVGVTADKYMKVTDLDGNEIYSVKTPFTRDLTGTAASAGCRLKFSDSQDYYFTSIEITYFTQTENQ